MKQKPFRIENLCNCLLVILLVVLAVNLYFVFAINQQLKPTPVVTSELPKLELYLLQDRSCSKCFDAAQLTVLLKQKLTEFNFTKEERIEYTSDNAKDLIKKYKITRVPALIIKGAIDKLDLPGLTKLEDAIVITELPPPYIDIQTKQLKGLVDVKAVYDKTCVDCTNASFIINQLKLGVGIVFSSKEEYEASSNEGKELIKKYNIKSLPALIFNNEINSYADIADALKNLGTKEDDESIVIRKLPPPYLDLETKKVQGIVSVTLLVDDSCKECYDPAKVSKLIAGSIGMKTKEKTVKVSSVEGKKLLIDYNITKVPTFILSSDASLYDQIKAWSQIGTVQKDGSYLFTNMELLKGTLPQVTYKDLSSDKIVSLEAEK